METLCPFCDHRTPAEQLLRDCVVAIEGLLASPDLNLDFLEPATQDAITGAQHIVQAVKMALTKST